MSEIIRIAIDLSKGAFALHGVNADEEAILCRQLKRGQVLGFFTKLSPCLVGMEACASAHYWAREIGALGHEVVLVPPAYVKPYVKRVVAARSDANDAAAICEAMARRSVPRVPVKTPEQQAVLMLHRARKMLVGQRTMLANAVRAHLAEFGIVAPCGDKALDGLIALAVDAGDLALPQLAREALGMLAAQLRDAEAKIDALEHEVLAAQRADEACRRLTSIPSIGPVTASAIAATMGDPSSLQDRPRLRRLARPGAVAALDRRQDRPWPHHQGRRPLSPLLARRLCHRHVAPPNRKPVDQGAAGTHAGTQGYRRHRQQAGPDRLGYSRPWRHISQASRIGRLNQSPTTALRLRGR